MRQLPPDQMVYVDADDFCEENDGGGVLDAIHQANPAFKITLFTIPALCTLPWLRKWLDVDWVRLCPHGWRHDTPRECENWDVTTSCRYLEMMRGLGFHRGFKAPGWQISTPMYEALGLWRYWVADQHYNDHRRPATLRTFFPDSPNALHYHVGPFGSGAHDNDIVNFADKLSAMTEVEFGLLGS